MLENSKNLPDSPIFYCKRYPAGPSAASLLPAGPGCLRPCRSRNPSRPSVVLPCPPPSPPLSLSRARSPPRPPPFSEPLPPLFHPRIPKPYAAHPYDHFVHCAVIVSHLLGRDTLCPPTEPVRILPCSPRSKVVPEPSHTRFARSSSLRVREEHAMASGSPLQPEICLGYLSALQAFALGVRTNQPITPHAEKRISIRRVAPWPH